MGLIAWAPGPGLTGMAKSGSHGAWTDFLSQIEKASWLASLLGTLIGVSIGGSLAIFVLRGQLRSDRQLFQQNLDAQRETERRLRRRDAAVLVAEALQPAADQLASFDGVDVWAEKWPGWKTTFEAIERLRALLWINDLFDLHEYAIIAINNAEAIWESAHRLIENYVAEHPGEYDPHDVRVGGAMRAAQFMTGRAQLQSLITMLLPWEGDTELPYEAIETEDPNRALDAAREEIARQLRPMEQISRLDRLRKTGKIGRRRYKAGVRRAMAELDRRLEAGMVRAQSRDRGFHRG